MFGYVRPALNRLSETEKSRYKRAYCGLCQTLGVRYGFISRFTLNYDFAFLAILLSGGEEEISCCRCPARPFRKQKDCAVGPAFDIAADESIILMWHKLSDDVVDNGFFAGLPSRFLRLILRKSYRKAADRQPAFDRNVCESMARLKDFEYVHSPQLDRVADAFAALLSAASCRTENENRRRVLEQLLYHLGRWIYLIDAWDDLEEDKKDGRYNPIDARFEGKAGENADYIKTTLTHSVRLMSAASNLIDFGQWNEIVSNVLSIGIPAVQTAVLSGRWKEYRSAREKNK